jgi:hypothetical protein
MLFYIRSKQKIMPIYSNRIASTCPISFVRVLYLTDIEI